LAICGSLFKAIYLLVLKCTALLAANKRAALDYVCAELHAIKPITRLELGFLMADPRAPELAQDIEAMLVNLKEDRARKLMNRHYNIFARRFLSLKHRRNVIRGVTTHMRRRFGEPTAPETLIGGGRYYCDASFKNAELAFTTADGYHSRGIASLVLQHLIRIGRENGILAFEADVLSENKAMIAVLSGSGLLMRRRTDGNVSHVELSLA
jgi:RimJ/RimL family protein N-acetyltransferase